MKKTYKIYILSGILFMLPGFFSCEDYLDREPESIVSEGKHSKISTIFRDLLRKSTIVFRIRKKITGLHHGTGVTMK